MDADSSDRWQGWHLEITQGRLDQLTNIFTFQSGGRTFRFCFIAGRFWAGGVRNGWWQVVIRLEEGRFIAGRIGAWLRGGMFLASHLGPLWRNANGDPMVMLDNWSEGDDEIFVPAVVTIPW